MWLVELFLNILDSIFWALSLSFMDPSEVAAVLELASEGILKEV